MTKSIPIETDFIPSVWLRPAIIQTVMASSRLRILGCSRFDASGQAQVLDLPGGLRTTTVFNLHPQAKGMIVLLHGWLGTPQAKYVISAAKALFDAGYSTARLTLPEHGDAVSLNDELVPITNHEVVRDAISEIGRQHPKMSLGLMGFSLGGNYALRVTRDLAAHPIERLLQVVAVSPVIEPEPTSHAIDESALLRRYFLRKFTKLYAPKLDRVPALNHLKPALQEPTTIGLTKAFLEHLGAFPDVETYFAAYRIKQDDLVTAAAPVTILTSGDDPIVDPGFAANLSVGLKVERQITKYGGHNGFVNALRKTAFCDRFAVSRFDRAFEVV
ncbi:MAG: alpha/beta fold hydrolase [Pseudomonadota bacterium]